MGIYKDITLFCDACGTEGYESTSVAETRRHAKQDGWKRKKVDGEWKDICPDCEA